MLLENLDGSSIRVVTGLSEAKPRNILVLPIVFEGEAKGVLELASVECFSPSHQAFLDQLTESIGIVINTIKANMRTEDLLTQSQSLAKQLQSRGEELQQTNEELQDKAKLLAQRNQEVERKNQEVEQARQALEDKADPAGAHLQVQVGVPGQHAPRAAHAAQQPADPVRPAVPEPRRQPDRPAGGVRQDHPLVGQRPAHAHQRHSRPVEDRVGHGRTST